jgi:hypothetical protein
MFNAVCIKFKFFEYTERYWIRYANGVLCLERQFLLVIAHWTVLEVGIFSRELLQYHWI